MKFNIKHLMVVSAVALAMIGTGGAINANNNNTVHAENELLRSYWKSEPQDAKWENVRGVYQNQANLGFNKKIGGTINANFKTGKPVKTHRKGHTITVVPMLDDPGKIIKVDGHRVHSRHQVLSLLRKHVYRSHYRKHYRKPKRYIRKHFKKHYRYITKKHVVKRHKAISRNAAQKAYNYLYKIFYK